jgi:hypothetical protein
MASGRAEFISRLLFKISGVLEEGFNLVKKLLLLQHVEGSDLLELHVESASEDGLGVLILEQGARLSIALGYVDGLLELIDPGGARQRDGNSQSLKHLGRDGKLTAS